MKTRFLKSVTSNGINSVISMAMSVMIARYGGVEALGHFGIAYAAYLLVTIVGRDVTANAFMAGNPSDSEIRDQSRRASLLGIFAALVLLVFGIFGNSYDLLILAVSIHGIVLLAHSKVLSLGMGDGRVALIQDAVLCCLFLLASALIIVRLVPVEMLFTSWAIGSAVIGYVSNYLEGHRMVPSLIMNEVEFRTSGVFGFQSLIGSGSAHILTFLIAGVGGAVIVGALRGASTMLGPSNLMATAVQPVLITALARSKSGQRSIDFRVALRISLYFTLGSGALTGVLYFVGSNFGELIFGSAWDASAPIFGIMALDVAVTACAVVPISAHRAMWASTRALRVTWFILGVRMILVLGGTLLWGAEGAAAGFLISTVISALVWWSSIVQLVRKEG